MKLFLLFFCAAVVIAAFPKSTKVSGFDIENLRETESWTSAFQDEIHRGLNNGDRFAQGDAWRMMVDGYLDDERHLQNVLKPCNMELDRVPRDAVLGFLQIVLSAVLPPDLIKEQLLPAFSALLQYDVGVVKVCGSCQDFYSESDDQVPPYCTSDFYGNDANHSALAFVPYLAAPPDTTGETNVVPPIPGLLRSVFSFHGATINADQSVTQLWPSSFAYQLSQLNTTNATQVVSLISTLLPTVPVLASASAGAVGIAPDYLGYGESKNTHNRSFIYPPFYRQAAMMSYYATADYVKQVSDGCSELSGVVTSTGYSEGGFATIAAAQAIQNANLTVLMNFPAVPALDSDQQIVFIKKSYDDNLISPDKNNYYSGVLVAFASFAGSIDTPGQANTGYPNQRFASSEYLDPVDPDKNIITWFASPDSITEAEMFPLLPVQVMDLLNPAYVDLIDQVAAVDGASACREGNVTEGYNDKICEAVLSMSAYPILENANFPTQICFSPNDTLISPGMFTESIVTKSVTYTPGIFGFPVQGDHGAASLVCMIPFLNMLLGLDSNGQPLELDAESHPSFVTNLECKGNANDTETPPENNTETSPGGTVSTEPPSSSAVAAQSCVSVLLSGVSAFAVVLSLAM